MSNNFVNQFLQTANNWLGSIQSDQNRKYLYVFGGGLAALLALWRMSKDNTVPASRKITVTKRFSSLILQFI